VYRTRVLPLLQFPLSAALLVAGWPGLARSQDPNAPKPAAPQPAQALATGESAAAAPAAAKTKPKKVWTNDELKSVQGGVSVVGDANQDTERRKYGNAERDSKGIDVHHEQVANYRKQIQQCREQIDAADKRIAQLKDFKAEDSSSSGGINLHQRYNMVPLEEQVKQLESKKKQLQAKIEEMESEARKNGIEPGELR
jgi:chromosome segregation ATPase